jgi:hypothetical protein
LLNVVCVLKKPENSHLKYDATWVQKLQRGVARNLTIPHRFVCLSDMEIPNVEVIPLQNNWMMYWSKIEMFRPGLFSGSTLYLDIDSMMTNNIDDIAKIKSDFVMLTDFYPSFKNSGLMRWDASNPIFSKIYTDFIKDPIGKMVEHRYKGAISYGDQEFIQTTLENSEIKIDEWQKIMPKDYFLEFSFENRPNPAINNPPKDVKICYCLGSPKFDSFPQLPLVQKNWY